MTSASDIKAKAARALSALLQHLPAAKFSAAAAASPFGGGSSKSGFSASRMYCPAMALLGLFAGMMLCWTLSGVLLKTQLTFDLETARAAGRRAPSFANAKSSGGLGDFTAANPFGADLPQASQTASAAAAIDSLALQGTLPRIGAWITGPDGATSLVLKGQEISGYKLEEIKYGEVVLSSGGKNQSLYLFLSGGAPAPAAPSPSLGGAPQKPKLDLSGVVAAGDGKEGAVPRELVDSLLMNPYEELNKMRMTPAPDGSGMKLERIAPDSVFARVGVAQDDVIQAINGVNISNMADAANAVNSLMSGTRFDVKVQRGGKPLELKYQVK